jgi:hypothetical protein
LAPEILASPPYCEEVPKSAQAVTTALKSIVARPLPKQQQKRKELKPEMLILRHPWTNKFSGNDSLILRTAARFSAD